MRSKAQLYAVAVHEAGHAVAALYLGFPMRWLQVEPKPLTLIGIPRRGNPSIMLRRLLAVYLAGIESDLQISGLPWPDHSKDQSDFWKVLRDKFGRHFLHKLPGFPRLTEESYPLATNLAKKIVYTNRNRIIALARRLAVQGGGRMYGEEAKKIAWRVKEQEPPEAIDPHVRQTPREWTLSHLPWGSDPDYYTPDEPPEPTEGEPVETESKWKPWPGPPEPESEVAEPITASEVARLGLSLLEVSVQGSNVLSLYRDRNGTTRVLVEPIHA